MREIHIGPHTRAESAEHEAAGTFDREINLKGIFWTVVGLTAVTVVAALLMWWLIVGCDRSRGSSSCCRRRKGRLRSPSSAVATTA